MGDKFQYSNSIRKLLLIFYSFAVLFGLYNIYANLTPNTPLREAVLIGFMWSDLIVIPFTLSLLVLSIIVIIKAKKKQIPKIHLIYSIYFPSFLILIIIVNLILYRLYDYNIVFSILDSLNRYHIIFFIWDVVFPSFIIYKQFPDFPKRIVKTIRKILYI